MTEEEETLLRDLKVLARLKGYFIVVKPGVHLLYRQAQPRNVFVLKSDKFATFAKRVKHALGA